MDGWVPTAADLGDPAGSWSIEVSSDVVSTGNGAARLRLDNENGAAKVWLVRAFEVEPERGYTVEVSLDLASADTADPWRVLAGAHTAPPAASEDLVVQDATETGDGEYAWSTRTYTLQGTADDEGNLYVVLGIWGTSPGDRAYYLDNVRLLFTRISAGG